MKRTLLYLVLVAVGTLATYESYAVVTAQQSLGEKFAPYSSLTPDQAGLSKERLEILVKVQDPTFYAHSGIEWPSPLTTTTITQSLVKKLFFEKFTKGFKKIEQTLIARFVVNPNIDKNTQLIAFMDTAYFGNKDGKPVYGFEQGARAWFNKPLSALTDEEYLSLIAMLPAPNRITPNSTASEERVRRIKKVLNGECSYQHVAQIHLEHCS